MKNDRELSAVGDCMYCGKTRVVWRKPDGTRETGFYGLPANSECRCQDYLDCYYKSEYKPLPTSESP